MRVMKAAIILAALLFSRPASSQTQEWVTIGKNCFAFHERALQVKLEPTLTSDVEILVELIGLPNVSKLNSMRFGLRRSYGVENAAYLEGGEEGCKIIVYNPDWAAGDTAEFYMVLGHEAGHHFCGHSVGNVHGTRQETELEADQFSGASIKRYEIYHNQRLFDQVYAAAEAKYPKDGSGLYPPRALRLAAMKRGYEQGSPCGNLSPAIPGFSPGQRTISDKRCRPIRVGPTSWICEP